VIAAVTALDQRGERSQAAHVCAYPRGSGLLERSELVPEQQACRGVAKRLVQELVAFKSDNPSVLVFTNRKSACASIERTVKRAGLTAASIHGDLDQWQRIEALNKFKAGKAQIVVATDVAARGLDINGVGLVVNYDFPPSGCENWVHRVGRTGRAGKTGHAITFFDPKGQEKKFADEFYELLTNSKTPIPEWLAPLAETAANDNYWAQEKKNFWINKGKQAQRWGGGGRGGGQRW